MARLVGSNTRTELRPFIANTGPIQVQELNCACDIALAHRRMTYHTGRPRSSHQKRKFMPALTMGVVGTSRKVDERRVPIHPDHLTRLPENIRRQLVFEKGYGERFGIPDEEMASQTGGVASRNELLADLGSVIIAKPVLSDLEELRPGGTLWGYPHSCSKLPSHKLPLIRN